MNNSGEKTTSSLAVVEKKPHRPGGCVGIFFQLFDWNRRFAKKKLFSKKLLSSGRLKKFGGDEKQPKLRLIADENSGGFPTSKKSDVTTNVEENNGMRDPGLVARLMGLESMPAVRKQKPDNVSASAVDGVYRHSKEDLNVDNGVVKHELRPQKLQKTNICERRSVTKFGAETLPLKNVLAKSRKQHHHHPKLPSPVKSPRNLSKRSSSRLIGAATRILEPGLQANRLKCALTYSNTLRRYPPRCTASEEKTKSLSSEMEDSNGFVNIVDEGQTSCANFSHIIDHKDAKPKLSEQPLVFSSPFSHRVVASSQKFDEELHDNYPEITVCVMDDCQSHGKFMTDVSARDEQTRDNSGNQPYNPQKNVLLPLDPIQDVFFQNQKLWARNKSCSRSKYNDLESRRVSRTSIIDEINNFVSGNRNLSGTTRPNAPVRKDYGKFEFEKRIVNTQNSNSVPPVRKKRPANISSQVQNPSIFSSVRNRQTHDSHYSISDEQLKYRVNRMSRQSGNSGHPKIKDRTDSRFHVDDNVVSLSLRSRVKQSNRSYEPAKRKAHNNIHCDDNSRELGVKEYDQRTKVEKPLPINGDALSALLEQKLKELNGQEDDSEANVPKKTTAVILQELISALTSDVSFNPDQSVAIYDGRNSSSSKSHFSKSVSNSNSQVNAAVVNPSMDQPLETEHLSPGSVLEAHFSNDSCLSSSVDESIGDKMQTQAFDFPSYGPRWPLDDSEFADYGTSIITREILYNVSDILCFINLANPGLKGSKLNHAKEILINAELVCCSSPVLEKSSAIKHLLLDELDMLTSVLWMNFGSWLGTEDGKYVNQLKGIAFDSVIEYLDTRFGNYHHNDKAGTKASIKLPLRINGNTLMLDIVEQVRRWIQLSKFVLDKLIEWEMSHSLHEWTMFETECFETGLEISENLLQVWIDEIVIDLWTIS